jgi:hypothetical protein
MFSGKQVLPASGGALELIEWDTQATENSDEQSKRSHKTSTQSERQSATAGR